MPQPIDLDALLGPAPASHPGPETVVLRVRRHGRVLVLPILVLIVVAGAAGYWVGALPESWMNLTAGAGAVAIALLFGFWPILAWLTRRTTITNHRIIFRHGVFVRHRAEMPFTRVREVRSRRSLPQRVFGSAHIDLYVGVEHTTLRDVPGAALVNDALQELVARNYEHSTGLFSPQLS